jgi:hypothetical protein
MIADRRPVLGPKRPTNVPCRTSVQATAWCRRRGCQAVGWRRVTWIPSGPVRIAKVPSRLPAAAEERSPAFQLGLAAFVQVLTIQAQATQRPRRHLVEPGHRGKVVWVTGAGAGYSTGRRLKCHLWQYAWLHRFPWRDLSIEGGLPVAEQRKDATPSKPAPAPDKVTKTPTPDQRPQGRDRVEKRGGQTAPRVWPAPPTSVDLPKPPPASPQTSQTSQTTQTPKTPPSEKKS